MTNSQPTKRLQWGAPIANIYQLSSNSIHSLTTKNNNEENKWFNPKCHSSIDSTNISCSSSLDLNDQSCEEKCSNNLNESFNITKETIPANSTNLSNNDKAIHDDCHTNGKTEKTLLIEKTRFIMNRLENVENKFNDQYSQIEQLENELYSFIKHGEKMKLKNEGVESKLEKMTDNNNRMIEYIELLEEKLKNAESINKNYIDNNTVNRIKYQHKKQIEEKNIEISELNNRINELYMEIDKLNKTHTDTATKYNSSISKLNLKYHKVKEINKQLIKQTHDNDYHNKTYLHDMNNLQKKLDESYQQNYTLSEIVDSLREKITTLTSRNKQLEYDLTDEKNKNLAYDEEKTHLLQEFGHFLNENEKNQSIFELTKSLVIRLQYTKNVILKLLCTDSIEHKLHYFLILADLCCVSDREISIVKSKIQAT